MSIRLILTDDHPLVLRGLSQLCRDEADFEVVAECSDGDATLAALESREADVLVLDLRLPRVDGFTVLESIHSGAARAKSPDLKVVLLTGNIGDEEVLRAMRLGVRGIVLKEMAPTLLMQCIRKVHAGGKWLEKESVGRALDKLLQKEERSVEVQTLLTGREWDVFQLAAADLQNVEIAAKLFISEGTVKTHLHSVYEKLGIRGRVQLMLYAQEHGLK